MSLTLESSIFFATWLAERMIICGKWTPQDWRSDSWVIETGLDWLDLIFMVPFEIQNGSIKPS